MGNKRVVHIVDDEETIRKALSFTLRTAGFAVEAYASGPEFLLSAEDAEKGCVVLDMHMPDMDGLQVQAELTRRGIDMPVVVLTGNGDPTLAVQAMKAGAADFLAKPVEKAALLGAIDRGFSWLEYSPSCLRTGRRSFESRETDAARTGRSERNFARLSK
jgi:FixJ family two-component response regulator